MRTFIGYRPNVPEHYIKGGYGNRPDDAQFQGVEFDDGTVAVRWLTQYRSTSIWPNYAEFEAVHGHADYGTVIVWGDDAKIAFLIEQNLLWQNRYVQLESEIDPDDCGNIDFARIVHMVARQHGMFPSDVMMMSQDEFEDALRKLENPDDAD